MLGPHPQYTYPALRQAGELTGPRVAIYAPPGRHYVEATWGAWLAGGIAVPLCLTHPPKCGVCRLRVV